MVKKTTIRLILIILLLTAIVITAILLLPEFYHSPIEEGMPRIFVPSTGGDAVDEEDRGNKDVLIARGDWGYPPLEYLNEKNEPEGFNVDILNRIAEILDMEIRIDLGPWDEVRTEIETGKIDILLGMYKTPRRKLLVDFTIPHFHASYGVFVPDNSSITTPEDIKNLKILVQKGDLAHDYLLENRIGRELVVVRDWEELLPALKEGKADCAIIGMVQGVKALEEIGHRGIRVISSPLFQGAYCIAVKKDDDALLARLNEGLNLLKMTGEYDRIYEKWFGLDHYPPFLTREALIILLSGILVLSLILAASLLWSHLLRKRVSQKTEELSRALEELKKANNTKNQFLARVSHELRTPLHGIIGMSRLLKKTELTKEQEELLGLMETASGQLYRILSDLLDISHLNTGDLSLHRSFFTISEIAEWIEPLLKETAKNKGLEFSLTCSGEDREIYSDRERISQIVINLADNAIKNTLRGSVHITMTCTEGQLLIEVTDTGKGIPPDRQKDIFSPFTRLETVNISSISGLGLGLSIVRSITELLEGMIKLESEPGKGTRIRIIVPIPGKPSTIEEIKQVDDINGPTTIERSDLPTGDVLLTEDEAINRLYIERLLHDRSWTSLSSTNGKDALKKATERVFSFILMDLSMPEMGGLEVTKHLRKFEEETGRTRTPVIALTAHAYEQTRIDCTEAGMDGFISKPFNEKEFWREIERVLKREPQREKG